MEEKAKKLNIPHYACTGRCGTVKDVSGKCPTSGCKRARNPLTECNCKDGKHSKVFSLYNW